MSKFAGLEDKGKIVIKCLGCNKHLMTVWVVGESKGPTLSVKTKCCFCNDDTGIKEIEGKVYVGSGDDVKSVEQIDITVNSDKIFCVYQSIA